MAATNFTSVALYHSATPSAVPTNTNLADGELAINIYDGKLYYKDNNGDVQLLASKTGSSNVTNVSLVSTNGFSGTVANPTTTPAITLSTSVSGVLKGSGGALVAASPGVDYAPATSGSAILYANGSGGFSSVTIGSNLTFAGGTLSATGGGSSGVSSFNSRTGAVTLASTDVTTALGFTPAQANGSNASGTWGINISGNAATVSNGVYMTSSYADPTWLTSLAGSKISGAVASATTATNATNATNATTAASCTGNSATVTNGVYTTGNQTIAGTKTFSDAPISTAYNFTSGSISTYYSSSVGIVTAIGSNGMWVTSAGDFVITGSNATKASGTTWINPSDIRLKDNIQPFSKGLTELVQINPKTWIFNGKANSKAGQTGTGVIADEIQSVLPETVTTYKAKLNPTDATDTDIKQFNADEIIWILVNSVKELKAEVDALKAGK